MSLAPRSVRDLIYSGRMPSARLGRRHFLRIPDVEIERRRRLGLSLPTRAAPAPRRTANGSPPTRAKRADGAIGLRVSADARAVTRHARAQERAAQLERWLRSGHGPDTPSLPFRVIVLGGEPAVCAVCGRSVQTGGRMVDAGPADGRAAARLCLTCARRVLLAWADSRRREAVVARRLAQALGSPSTLRPDAAGGT